MKKLNLIFLSIFCLLFLVPVFGQIKISEEIQASKIVTQRSNKLYLVDFWATWCGPCVHAKKYLGSLQKQYPKDFYVISISEETPSVVKKYLAKRPTDLAVAIDYDKQTFAEHNIRSLPYAVLYNANGKRLWEGHPADFKASDIKRYLSQNSERIDVREFIQLEAYKMVEEQDTEVYEPGEDFEIMPSNANSSILDVTVFNDYTSYEGRLQSILAYLLSAHDAQVKLSPSVGNSVYKLNIKHDSRKHKNIVKHVLKSLKLQLKNDSKAGNVLVLSTNTSKFWDTNQIDWGKNNAKYLIGDDNIQADNVSFEDIKYRLSNLLEMPVMVSTEIESTSLHDWQIHYKFFELMQSDLSDNYGIDIKQETQNYPIYIIQKKTP